MQNIIHDIEKGNGAVPFRTWDGWLVVAVPCGGWRLVRPLDLALMPSTTRRLVLVRDTEDWANG